MTTHAAPPVAGYKPITQERLDAVNANKNAEEQILRILDSMVGDDRWDQRWLSIGRTHFEQAFMALNRSIFRPGRIVLPGDEKTEA